MYMAGYAFVSHVFAIEHISTSWMDLLGFVNRGFLSRISSLNIRASVPCKRCLPVGDCEHDPKVDEDHLLFGSEEENVATCKGKAKETPERSSKEVDELISIMRATIKRMATGEAEEAKIDKVRR